MSGPAWIKAPEGTSSAFEAVEGLCGAVSGYGNSSLLECRNNLAHTVRRLTNLAVLHGAKPAAVEEAKK